MMLILLLLLNEIVDVFVYANLVHGEVKEWENNFRMGFKFGALRFIFLLFIAFVQGQFSVVTGRVHILHYIQC